MKHLRQTTLLLILLAIATAMGLSGASLSTDLIHSASDDVAQGPSTEVASRPVYGESAASTPAPEPTSAPAIATDPTSTQRQESQDPASVSTPLPTEAAVQVQPTPTPVETPRPDVPANTTGASIIVERGVSDRDLVALTFDAGEGPGYADEILDFLATNGLRASFGLTGDWVRTHPDEVRRMIDEGHMVFNHSDTHLSWTGASTTGTSLSEDQRIDELMGAAIAVEDVAGYETAPFWRPPYGDYDAEGQVLLAEYGYDYTLFWTCDSLAWTGTTAEEIVERCAPDAPGGGPGAIILMHVTQEADYRSLEALVAAYLAEGYEFVTMEEMIAD
jgi:peptidoglycan-N-acetylglucosamine deacetylase